LSGIGDVPVVGVAGLSIIGIAGLTVIGVLRVRLITVTRDVPLRVSGLARHSGVRRVVGSCLLGVNGDGSHGD